MWFYLGQKINKECVQITKKASQNNWSNCYKCQNLCLISISTS